MYAEKVEILESLRCKLKIQVCRKYKNPSGVKNVIINLQEFSECLITKIRLKNPKPCPYDQCKSKIDMLTNFWFSKCCTSIQLRPITWDL